MPQSGVTPLNVTKGIVDINKINKTAQECIARAFLPMVEDYFKDPAVQHNYELWLAKRKKSSV